jgi:DnaJ homolog subfamily B member 12
VSEFNNKRWSDLDRRAETGYMHYLQSECEAEQLQQARLYHEAQGWFYNDEQLLKRAREMKLPSCKKLNEYGRR